MSSSRPLSPNDGSLLFKNNDLDHFFIEATNASHSQPNMHDPIPPPPPTPPPPPPIFSLNWQHIANAISQEMYQPLSAQIMTIIKRSDIKDTDLESKTVRRITREIRKEREIEIKEIQYIKGIISRAQSFQPSGICLSQKNKNIEVIITSLMVCIHRRNDDI